MGLDGYDRGGPRPPEAIRGLVADVTAALGDDRRLAAQFARCFTDTWTAAMRPRDDGTVFVRTGDIPAMWLRDSAFQVRPYLALGHDRTVADALVGVVRQQVRCVLRDPYANAFNARPDGASWDPDDVTDSAYAAAAPWVWERKYELDSLCHPLQLAHLVWRATGRTDHLDDRFRAAARLVLRVWRVEQDHRARSPYRFRRPGGPPGDTLVEDGLGPPVVPTGMTWSGFRPSDDACRHGYLVPANMLAAVALDGLVELADRVLGDADLADSARALGADLRAGIAAHAEVDHPRLGRIWAYEVDGAGSALVMDDANPPSLLSLPYLGWCAPDDPLYLATRAAVLGPDNPHHVRGTAASGVGSPHTPPRHVWPLALAVQGLTALDPAERADMLALLSRTDAGTGVMHESFHADDPGVFTRPWFGWANAMFCELVLAHLGLRAATAPAAGGGRAGG